jgi:hypothetical protein
VECQLGFYHSGLEVILIYLTFSCHLYFDWNVTTFLTRQWNISALFTFFTLFRPKFLVSRNHFQPVRSYIPSAYHRMHILIIHHICWINCHWSMFYLQKLLKI